MINVLKLLLFVWLSTSFVVTIPIVLTMTIQAYFEGLKKSDHEATGNAIVIFFFSFLIGFLNVLRYTCPFLLLIWLPLWLLRKNILIFDNNILSVVVGCILGLAYWLLLSRFDPHFRETLNTETSSKWLFCFATVAGGGIMCWFGQDNMLFKD